MIKIAPATLHRSDDPRLSEISAAMVGERLTAVHYAVPAGNSWEDYADVENVHEVDMGVEVSTGSGWVLRISWATPGLEEGLELEFDRADPARSNDLIDLVDMGDQLMWSSILGCQVQEVGVAFLVHVDDSSTRPWAFRIGLLGGSSVTIALGEVYEGSLRYFPDNLLVISDESVARDYRIPNGVQSARGEVIR
jgi:hypothetical protein